MTKKHLVIVESPAKARTINKYIGSGYMVTSCVGHIRDLPTAGSQNSRGRGATTKSKKTGKTTLTPEQRFIHKLSIDPHNGWKARYEILPGKEKILEELKRLATRSEGVILATDIDREGEAIAWHLREALGGDPQRFKRVKFTEITAKALKHAFQHPEELNMQRVHAQQTRRFLDRVVGFTLSPLLWQKVARGLSAGRVQSVAVRLIVEREKEIKSFHPEEFWQIHVQCSDLQDLKIPVTKYAQKTFKCSSQEEAHKHVEALDGATITVSAVQKKIKTLKPSPPFITSTLQQTASSRLGYGVQRTMSIAQRLYESGLITYMRTDSTHMSEDAMTEIRSHITEAYGPPYLASEVQIYRSGSSAQEAHEAIRPTAIAQTPAQLKDSLEPTSWNLYNIIWRRTVATQMQAMKYEATTQFFQVADYELKISGRVILFEGFYKVLPPVGTKKSSDASGREDQVLPALEEGQTLLISKVHPSQHFTKPPPRFSEARFVRELEKRGIGRPSTYAAIISTIQDRGYVQYEKKQFFALKIGEVVTNKLMRNFQDLMNYDFTAHMEEKLDDIAAGHLDWIQTLDAFYSDFSQAVDHANTHMSANTATPTEIPCPHCEGCDGVMMIKTASTGVFLSCSRYNLPAPADRQKSSGTSSLVGGNERGEKEKGGKKQEKRCKYTLNLHSTKDYMAAGSGKKDEKDKDKKAKGLSPEEEQLLALRTQRRCPLCQSTMDSYIIDDTRKLHVCSQNPECPGHELEYGSFKMMGYDGPVIDCDRCNAKMELKKGRFGPYFACTECPNTRKMLKNGEPAPPKADPVPMPELPCEKSQGHFILRDGAAGIFLASSLFPRSRETKKPRVVDLKRHRAELDPKHVFLADAPTQDPEGRDFLVRFQRKNKQYYLNSELEPKKASPWVAFYDGKTWNVTKSTKTKTKTKKADTKSKSRRSANTETNTENSAHA